MKHNAVVPVSMYKLDCDTDVEADPEGHSYYFSKDSEYSLIRKHCSIQISAYVGVEDCEKEELEEYDSGSGY